jgi:hypothetical protein
MQLSVFCCGDFDLFLRFVLRQVPICPTLYFDGEGLQACVAWGVPQPLFFQRLLDLVVSSEWFLRSSKPCVTIAFAGVPFPCCLSSAFFNLRWMTNNQMKKTTRELFNVFLFFILFCVKLSFFYTTNYLDSFPVSSLKKRLSCLAKTFYLTYCGKNISQQNIPIYEAKALHRLTVRPSLERELISPRST